MGSADSVKSLAALLTTQTGLLSVNDGALLEA